MMSSERGELDMLNKRIDYVASTCRLLALNNDVDSDMADALAGLGHTLNDIAEKVDAILYPRKTEGRA